MDVCNGQATRLDLCSVWREQELIVNLPGMAGFAHSPSLGNKLRGALGETLLASASARVFRRQACDWARPSTADMFFGPSPPVAVDGAQHRMARPYVLFACAGKGGALDVHLRIFGSAAERAEAVFDAQIAALSHRVDWQAMSRDGPRFLPGRIQPSQVRVRQDGKPRVPLVPAEVAVMAFLSPVDAERGNPAANPDILLDRLIRRAALLAPWFGASLAVATGELRALARQIRIEADGESSVPAPATGGHRHANALCPPMRFRLSNIPAEFWPLLAMGERMHIGRGANLGLGRYRLLVS